MPGAPTDDWTRGPPAPYILSLSRCPWYDKLRPTSFSLSNGPRPRALCAGQGLCKFSLTDPQGFPLRRLEEMLSRAHDVLDHNLRLVGLPLVQLLEEVTPNFLHAQHMMGALKDHCLEDDKPLGIPVAILESGNIHGQRTNKAPAHLPYRKIIPEQMKKRKVATSCLSLSIISDPSSEMMTDI